jgi:hypothetical protein
MKTEQNLAVNQWEKINESEVGESDLGRESAATAQGLTRATGYHAFAMDSDSGTFSRQ